MMKDILGPALGGLVAGGIAIFAGQVNSPPAAPVAAPALMMEAPIAAEPVAPAAVRPASGAVQYVHYLPAEAEGAPMVRSYPTTPAATPVVYRPQDDIVRYEPAPRRAEAPKRSAAKTAMVIAGSAGAGAGVGGLAGGKKGALIGAAIGGGAASIWEATKR